MNFSRFLIAFAFLGAPTVSGHDENPHRTHGGEMHERDHEGKPGMMMMRGGKRSEDSDNTMMIMHGNLRGGMEGKDSKMRLHGGKKGDHEPTSDGKKGDMMMHFGRAEHEPSDGNIGDKRMHGPHGSHGDEMMKKDMKKDMKAMKKDMKQGAKEMKKDMKNDIQVIKKDMKKDIVVNKHMKKDTKQMKGDIQEIKTDTRTDIGMKKDMKQGTKEIKMDMKKDSKEMKTVMKKDSIMKKDMQATGSDFFEACTYPCEFEGKDGVMKQGVLVDFSYPFKEEQGVVMEEKQLCVPESKSTSMLAYGKGAKCAVEKIELRQEK